MQLSVWHIGSKRTGNSCLLPSLAFILQYLSDSIFCCNDCGLCTVPTGVLQLVTKLSEHCSNFVAAATRCNNSSVGAGMQNIQEAWSSGISYKKQRKVSMKYSRNKLNVARRQFFRLPQT